MNNPKDRNSNLFSASTSFDPKIITSQSSQLEEVARMTLQEALDSMPSSDYQSFMQKMTDESAASGLNIKEFFEQFSKRLMTIYYDPKTAKYLVFPENFTIQLTDDQTIQSTSLDGATKMLTMLAVSNSHEQARYSALGYMKIISQSLTQDGWSEDPDEASEESLPQEQYFKMEKSFEQQEDSGTFHLLMLRSLAYHNNVITAMISSTITKNKVLEIAGKHNIDFEAEDFDGEQLTMLLREEFSDLVFSAICQELNTFTE